MKCCGRSFRRSRSIAPLCLVSVTALTVAFLTDAGLAASVPRSGVAERTAEFSQTFEGCGAGYGRIVLMLENPGQTDAQQVAEAVGGLVVLCATIGRELAKANTALFVGEALDAEKTLGLYQLSLRHLASYIRTQSEGELNAAQRFFSEAASRDLRTQGAINVRRRAYGLAPLRLRNQNLAAGPQLLS